MTNAMTQEWTQTLDEKYGAAGTLGRQGEEKLYNFLLNDRGPSGEVIWDVKYYPEDKEKQLYGIDIEVRKMFPHTWGRHYSADVKTGESYINQAGDIFIPLDPKGFLFTRKKPVDRIWNINPTTWWSAYYDKEDMAVYLESLIRSGKINPNDQYFVVKKAASDYFYQESKVRIVRMLLK